MAKRAPDAAAERDQASEVAAVRRAGAAGEGEGDRLGRFVAALAAAPRQEEEGKGQAECAEHRRDHEAALEAVGQGDR